MTEPRSANQRILIVDDEDANIRVLTRFLAREGYADVHATTDARQALPLFLETDPDLILLDLRMPFLNGMAVLEALSRATGPGAYVPVLMLTGDTSPEARKQALALGAHDFLTKPFDFFEARYRIRNLLHTRRLHVELRARNEELERRVRSGAEERERMHGLLLERLAARAGAGGEGEPHPPRAGRVAAAIARALELPDEQVRLIGRAAPLHDLGRFATSDAILRKSGTLDDAEVEAMEAHAQTGAALLAGGATATMDLAAQIAGAHHERWDGTGHPRGLRGDEIPASARIVAAADLYVALASHRPHRPALQRDGIIGELRTHRGAGFDPAVIDALIRLVEQGTDPGFASRPPPVPAPGG